MIVLYILPCTTCSFCLTCTLSTCLASLPVMLVLPIIPCHPLLSFSCTVHVILIFLTFSVMLILSTAYHPLSSVLFLSSLYFMSCLFPCHARSAYHPLLYLALLVFPIFHVLLVYPIKLVLPMMPCHPLLALSFMSLTSCLSSLLC